MLEVKAIFIFKGLWLWFIVRQIVKNFDLTVCQTFAPPLVKHFYNFAFEQCYCYMFSFSFRVCLYTKNLSTFHYVYYYYVIFFIRLPINKVKDFFKVKVLLLSTL